jgi:putative FmdB family regulatory protein
MPIYEYNCEHCQYKFDRMVTTHKAQVKCPLCQEKWAQDVYELRSVTGRISPELSSIMRR